MPTARKVLVGIIAYRFQTYAGLSLSLGAAGQALARYPFAADFVSVSNTIVAMARNEVLSVATQGYDYAVMLDDDVTFESSMLGEVLSLSEAYEDCVVAGVRAPHGSTGKSVVQPDLGDKVGFRSVERLGGAALFINMSRLHSLQWGEQPYFKSTPLPDGTLYGEDYFFCDRVRDKGGQVYCHHNYEVVNGSSQFRNPGAFS